AAAADVLERSCMGAYADLQSAEFDAEKDVVIEELRISLDSPAEALDQGVWAAAFWQHPYRHPVIGWLDDLERVTIDQMSAYYRSWYHPVNANLVIAGDFDTQNTLKRVEDLFGGIRPGAEPLPILLREAEQRGERRVIVKRAAEVERLQIAFHVPQVAHTDSATLQIVAALLGEGTTSRLYQRLIERDRSAIRQSVDYTERIDPGLFIVRIEVKPEGSLQVVERATLEEIDRLTTAPVSETELAKAKRVVSAQFILGQEELANQAITLGLYETIKCFEHLSRFMPLIEQVTAEDVRLVAQRYFGEDNRTVGYLVAEKASVK
ncbi:MAG: pitrilysin family protein, partial [Acidobacteriota bacterium]